MDKLAEILEATLRWARRCGLDEFQIATAQSQAWYYWQEYDGPEDFPAGHWARLAVRGVRNGRDLPGCGTSVKDALLHSWQGAAMPEVMDRSPGPDVLVIHKELLERLERSVDDLKRQVAELRLQGLSNAEVARKVNRSPGRTSQIAREFVEGFDQE